jgi:excisionase family DNA binding protein
MKHPYRVKADASGSAHPNRPTSGTLLLTRDEVAQELRVSTKTIDRLITKGYFKPIRIGKLIRIPVTELQKFAKRDHPVLS